MNIINSELDTKRRYGSNGLKLFVEDNQVLTAIHKWFMDNKLYAMEVKSKAWTRLSGKAIKMMERKIAAHFNIPPANVKYSRKCGCSCGCSPGYNVKLPSQHLLCRHNGWANVDTTPEDLALIENLIATKIPKLFAADKQREVDTLSAQLTENHKKLAVA